MGKGSVLLSISSFRRTSASVSVLAIVVGLAGLAGWLFRSSVLTSIVPGTVRITANTAICMVLLGLSLWFQRNAAETWKMARLARVLAGVVSCIGALSLLEIIYGWNLHIDQLLVVPTAQEAIGAIRPGLMSPITASCLLLLGLGLALLDWTTKSDLWPAQMLAVVSELASSFALLDYILAPSGHHTAIALQTAIVLCAFPIGLLCARPQRGLGKLIVDTVRAGSSPERSWGRRIKSRMLRYGLPIVLVVLAAVFRAKLGDIGISAPFLTFYPAVMVVCLFAGVGPGLLCVLLSGVCADYFFLPPFYTFGMDTLNDSIALDIFLLTGTGYCLLLGTIDLYRRRAREEARIAEIEIRKSETKYRTLVENLTQKIVYKDRNSRYVSCNSNCARDLHITPDEIAGKTDYDFFPRELAEKYRADDRRVMELGESEQLEEHYVLDGKSTWVNTVKTPVRDENGNVNGILVIFWDITDRKLAEDRLREQAALLELAQDAIIVRSTDAHILFWNRGASDLYGWSADEARGRISHELLQTTHPEPLADIEARVSERGEWEGELTHVCRDGRRVVVASRWSPQRDERGDPIGFLEINRDITERKEAEAALRAERQRFEAMLDALPAMICLLTPDHGVAFANHAMRKDFGTPDGRKCHDYLYGRDTPCTFCEAYQVLETGVAHDWEVKLTTGSTVHVYNVPFTDFDGSPLILEMDVDVTEQRKAEEAVRRNEAELKEAQRIAHLGSWEMDVANGEVRWTEELFRMYGLDAAEKAPPYEMHHRLFTPASWEILSPAVENLARHGQPYELELETVRTDGSTGWMHVRGEAVRSRDGVITRLRGVAFDITERKRAELKVLDERQKFNSILDVLTPYVVLLTPDYHVAFANREFRRRFGESNGKHCYEFLFGISEPCENCETYKVLKTGQSQDWEWTGPDGRSYEIHDFPFTDTDGSRLILEMGIDVTERKQAELAREESETRFRVLANFVPQLVWMCHPDGMNFYFNQRWVDYTGMSLEESYGRGWNTPFHPDDKQAAWDAWNLATATGETYKVESRLRRADGTYRWFLMRGTPLLDAEGRITRWFGTCTDIHEMKQAEESLRRLNLELEDRVKERTIQLQRRVAELQTVFDTVPIGLAMTEDSEARHIRGNPQNERLLGTGPGAELSQTSPECAPYRVFRDGHECTPEELPMQRAARGASIAGEIIQVMRPDGVAVTLHSSAAPLFDEDGNPRGAVGAFVDITEQKRIEKALRESEDLLRAVTDNSPDAIYVKDRSSRWLMANPAVLRIVGKTAEQALGKTDLDLYADAAVGRAILENDRRTMEEGRIESFEETADTPDGRRVYLSVKAPRRDAQGNIIGLVGISRDITERKRMEEALRESESRFRTLADNVPDLVWTCTPDGKCDYLNSRWVEYTGIPEEGQHGYGWLKQVHPEDQERLMEAWKAAVERVELFDIEFRIRAKDGCYRWFKARAVAVRDPDGQIVKWFGTNTDIEDLRQSQEKLAAVNKELESFNYAIAHDLRAPLRHIRGFSDLLIEESGPALNETARRYLSTIQGGVERMGALIEDLLSLSRLGRQEIRKQICGLESLVDQVIAELQPGMQGRTIEWRIGELGFADCDPSLFKQVLINLIGNAVKFTRGRDPAVIEIGQTEVGDEPALYIRDNGVGFEMKYYDKLFGLFQRLHRQEDFEGTGIGLAIVQRIMHRHGGSVWAEAQLNRGATFYVQFHPAQSGVDQRESVAGRA